MAATHDRTFGLRPRGRQASSRRNHSYDKGVGHSRTAEKERESVSKRSTEQTSKRASRRSSEEKGNARQRTGQLNPSANRPKTREIWARPQRSRSRKFKRSVDRARWGVGGRESAGEGKQSRVLSERVARNGYTPTTTKTPTPTEKDLQAYSLSLNPKGTRG
jgi:hypothetical protein